MLLVLVVVYLKNYYSHNHINLILFIFPFKIVTLDSHKLLVGAGTAADCVNFNEFIGKNMKLYELNNDIQLSTKAAANYIRGEVQM